MATRRKRVSKSKSTTKKSPRLVWEDSAKIKVVGDHHRHKDSRYGKAYEQLKTVRTVGAFRAKRKDGDAQEILRAATKDEYIRVA